MEREIMSGTRIGPLALFFILVMEILNLKQRG